MNEFLGFDKTQTAQQSRRIEFNVARKTALLDNVRASIRIADRAQLIEGKQRPFEPFFDFIIAQCGIKLISSVAESTLLLPDSSIETTRPGLLQLRATIVAGCEESYRDGMCGAECTWPQRQSKDCGQERLQSRGKSPVPQFDRQLVALMRTVLDDVMARVPPEISNTATKALLAECILKAAAQGHTSYNELLAAATDHIQTIITMFS